MKEYLDKAVDEILLAAHQYPKLRLALVGLLILGLSTLFVKILL